MALKDFKKRSPLVNSFGYAFSGIFKVIKEERNIKIHLFAALVSVGLAIYLQISRIDWLILLLIITLVISLELVNSAIEAAVDLASPDQHPLAKKAKDVAAGAVLVAAIISIIIGALLFFPYFTILR
ncbi:MULTISPECIES: diacylglycerol kinase family protein [unclassified Bacillus (in: firmicutes)]|uniref:diacylglycerol kinase family protein n=1 Tax=unclassified Bacillus (in: firmicutes) TaxID=185979 RepID=UPI000BF20619|nr:MULTISPECIES: diacylglycerol kinase family protein [unclassified Bacillus (in: firmicutes)]PEJ56904.1 diacylglycerol kinase [Bacillus sp. AFS002410]PEL11365.1 diacylglycerol kinase [Bacillus sp. AFS017336]